VACAATHSPEPVVRREWVAAGTHLNSVGLSPEGPEVDAATVVDALVVVESRQQALAPWPTGLLELVGPLRDGLITPEHIHAELGELVTGARPGRTSAEQITLYKSAVQDAARGPRSSSERSPTGCGTRARRGRRAKRPRRLRGTHRYQLPGERK
jgi:ornithine cyclodeaminase